MKALKFSAFTLLAVALFIPVFASVQKRKGRPAWPKTEEGVYIAISSETIPLFGRALGGYRPSANADYWGHSLPENVARGSMRIFEGNGWEAITDFPMTMNHCSDGVFMIRWRSANPNVRVESALGYHHTGVIFSKKTGSFGYMQGHNCEEPMFRFGDTMRGNESNLVDIYYELKFWRAAP